MLVVLLMLGAMLALAVPASARGGNGNKAVTVCWMGGAGETWANFQTTGSGIVQQFRYEPVHKHLIFKPMAKFPNMPDGEGWFQWTAHTYPACSDPTDKSISDVFDIGAKYWVKMVDQG
jgi:hypothetical protein